MPLSPVDGPLGGDFDGWTRVMLAGIGQSLPIAVGLLLAATPMVIIAVLLVVKRPARVTGAFLAGWMLGLAAEPAAWASWVKIGLGVLLAGLAMRKWQARPGEGDEPTAPKWMAAADTMTARRAFVVALLLAALNPKHLVIVVAGATTIADATARVHEQVIALVVFVAVASLGVATPAVARLLLGDRADSLLAVADEWMIANNAAIMAVVLVVLGAVLIGNGVAAL